jgi:hypothetical protein
LGATVHATADRRSQTVPARRGRGGSFQALRYFALDGTGHGSHAEQASMIRRYIIWRNRDAHDRRLREIISRAKRCLTALTRLQSNDSM